MDHMIEVNKTHRACCYKNGLAMVLESISNLTTNVQLADFLVCCISL